MTPTWLFWAPTAAAEGLWPELLRLLDAEERRRLNSYGHAGAARAYGLGHALCRLALSACFPATAATAWRYARAPMGKPQVRSPAPAPSFSLSHTHGVVACALQAGPGPVGLDVENYARAPLSDRLCDQIFTARERRALSRQAAPRPQADARLALWSAKEAYLKALGCGLHEAMQGVEIVLQQPIAKVSRRSRRFDVGAGPWSLRWGRLQPSVGYALARTSPDAARPLQQVACTHAWLAQQIASMAAAGPSSKA